MPTLESIAIFALASAVLILIPGPAVLYIVARSVHQGRTAGIVSALGVEIGSMVHIVGAALGLSAILVSSSVAFSAVKFAGAAYLIYLGIRTLLAREATSEEVVIAPMKLRRLFGQGVIVNVLNPKVALFFFAFFPQFVDPSRGSVALQTLVLGVVFCVVGTTLDCTWAMLAGSAGSWLKGNGHFLRRQRFVTGAIYLGLGVTTAFAGHGKSK